MWPIVIKAFLAGLQQLVAITPWEQLRFLAIPLAQTLWWGLPKRRALTIDNLCHALNLPRVQAVGLAKQVFQHVALTALEFLKMGTDPRGALAKIELHGVEAVKEAWEKHKGLLLVTGHLGNFELLGARLAQEFPLWVIARPQNLASWQTIKRIREKAGMRVLEKLGSVREALRILRQGGAIGILADQHAGEGKGSLVVPFFGRPASVFKTPALLAVRAKVPFVFCYDQRQPDGHHVGVLLPPRMIREEEVEAVTLWYCRQLEQAIWQAPDQWWWLHDRWKTARRLMGNCLPQEGELWDEASGSELSKA